MSRARAIGQPPPRIGRERMLAVIRAPVVTEKSTLIGEYNQITFRVAMTPPSRKSSRPSRVCSRSR